MSEINFGFWAGLKRPIVGSAPMDGVTDAAYRQITVKYGRPDVVFTEFVPVEGLARNAVKLLDHLLYAETERPVVAQVYGIEPASFRVAAQIVAALGFDGLDINMGCPAKKVSRRGAGAALITNHKLAEQIIESCKEGLNDWAGGMKVEEIPVKEKLRRVIVERRAALKLDPGGPRAARPRSILPLSVKTRIGYDKNVIVDWAAFLATQGLAAVAIHGRTLKQLYSGAADWAAIEEGAKIIHQNSKTLVLGNGDVHSRAEAVERAARHQVDGVLIGRAAQGNPWVFADRLPTDHERLNVALEHARLHESLYPSQAFPAFRRHLAAYVKGLPQAAAIRSQLMQATSAIAVEETLFAKDDILAK